MRMKNIYLLILLACCWGPSFLFIKIAVEEVPPMILAGLRIGIGALILNIILLTRKERLPMTRDFWKKTLIAGFFAQGLPFTLINWGEQYVDSSLASLLNGLVPLFTIVLAQIMLTDERMTVNKLKGVLLGFSGLLFLIYPNIKSGLSGSLLGILAITAAAISYGIGLVYIRKNLIGIPSFHAPAAQLLSVMIYLLPISLMVSPDFQITNVSWPVIGAIAILGLFGTAIAFILYFKLIQQSSASYASMVTYLMPVIGVILGITFLNESLTPWMIGGAFCILAGIYIGNKMKIKIKQQKINQCIDVKLYSPFR
jgi:drug/metabolite transporter (DMT)-like permease